MKGCLPSFDPDIVTLFKPIGKKYLHTPHMDSLADNPRFKDVLNQHRAFLKEHAKRHNDRVATEMLRNAR